MLIGQKDVQAEEAERFDIFLPFAEHPSGIMIDGGAHVGSWTVEMARVAHLVFAFEPCSESFTMLKENCRGLTNVNTCNAALTERMCRGNSVKPRGKRETLTARQFEIAENGDTRGVAIDDLNLSECGLIKLDLEGGELAALMGARQTIKKCRPFLIIEFNRDYPSTKDGSLLNYLTDVLGYEEVWQEGVDKGFRYGG